MPQTRFVLKKALELGHTVVVVVNKVDRPSARVEYVVNSTFELFLELNATDEQVNFCAFCRAGKIFFFANLEALKFMTCLSTVLLSFCMKQCDFQVVYASGIQGKAGLQPDTLADDLEPLFESVIRCIPEPRVQLDAPLQMLVTLSHHIMHHRMCH